MMSIPSDKVYEFVRESNRIEGILRDPTDVEIDAHLTLLRQVDLSVEDVAVFVSIVADAELRDRPGMDVRVGNHFPPKGGPVIFDLLTGHLSALNARTVAPYRAHVRYETLHPFMDGNGRSGRALWAWQMQRDGRAPFALSFLHCFYYQTLDASHG